MFTVILLLLVLTAGVIDKPLMLNVPILYNGFGLFMLDIDGVPVILPIVPLLSLTVIIYLF